MIGSGTILQEVIAAADILEQEFGIASDIFIATSFSELARDAEEVARLNRRQPGNDRKSHVEFVLEGDMPVVASTDYVRAVPNMIAPHVPGRFVALGTDGFGRSDQRAHLRSFFEVNRYHVVLAAIEALVRDGHIAAKVHEQAVSLFALPDAPAPWTV